MEYYSRMFKRSVPPPPIAFPSAGSLQAKPAARIAVAPPPTAFPSAGGLQTKPAARIAVAPPPVRFPVQPAVQAKAAVRHLPPPAALPRQAAVQPKPATPATILQRMLSSSSLQRDQARVNAEKDAVTPFMNQYYDHTLGTYIATRTTGQLTTAIGALERSIAARRDVLTHFTDTTTDEYKGHANRIRDEEAVLARLLTARGPRVAATPWTRHATRAVEVRTPAYWSRDGRPPQEERNIPDSDGFTLVGKRR